MPPRRSTRQAKATKDAKEAKVKEEQEEEVKVEVEVKHEAEAEAVEQQHPQCQSEPEQDEYELTEKEMKEVNSAFDMNCSTDGKEQLDCEDLKTALRSLGFEPRTDEIKKLFSKFAKRGKMNRDGFHKVMALKFGSSAGRNDNSSYDEISKVFNLLDIDKTGFITLENLKSIAKELNEEISLEELREMISEADMDGDFIINKEEFLNIMKKTSLY